MRYLGIVFLLAIGVADVSLAWRARQLQTQIAALREEAEQNQRALSDLARRLAALPAPLAQVAPDDVESELARLQSQIAAQQKQIQQKLSAPPPSVTPTDFFEGQPVFSSRQIDPKGKPKVVLASQARPTYPPELRRKEVEGEVRLSFVIDTQGAVHDIKVAGSTNHAFDEAAIAAVEQWRFTPGTRQGAPVNVRYSLPVAFSLGNAVKDSRWFAP